MCYAVPLAQVEEGTAGERCCGDDTRAAVALPVTLITQGNNRASLLLLRPHNTAMFEASCADDLVCHIMNTLTLADVPLKPSAVPGVSLSVDLPVSVPAQLSQISIMCEARRTTTHQTTRMPRL